MSSQTVEWCGWCGEEPEDDDPPLRPRTFTDPTLGVNVHSSSEVRRHGAWSLDLCLECAIAWDRLDMATILAHRHRDDRSGARREDDDAMTLYTRTRQCDGKIAHQRKADAKAHAVRITSSIGTGNRRRAVVYRCPHCRLWHVGHPPTTDRSR